MEMALKRQINSREGRKTEYMMGKIRKCYFDLKCSNLLGMNSLNELYFKMSQTIMHSIKRI